MVTRFDPQGKSPIHLVYYSQTGQTERFIEKVLEKVNIQTIKIEKDMMIDTKYILLTPTYMFGEVPEEVVKFLSNNSENMLAVMSSGNRNWGSNFAKAGDIISSYYKVELIGKYELAGTNKDVDTLVNYIERK